MAEEINCTVIPSTVLYGRAKDLVKNRREKKQEGGWKVFNSGDHGGRLQARCSKNFLIQNPEDKKRATPLGRKILVQ